MFARPEIRPGVNNPRAPVGFRFHLLSNCTHHVVGSFNGSDLDVGDLDAPSLSLRIKAALHFGAEFHAFGKHFNIARDCLRQHDGGRVVLSLDDRPFGISITWMRKSTSTSS
jgi:hypothetical protein